MSNGLGERVLGVLGGMGPLATADFMRRVIELTPAKGDDDHIPQIVSSCPQIPDRWPPIMGVDAPSPLPALKERLATLLAAGARCIAMPCNTAHFWYDDLARDCPVPFINIVDATVAEMRRRGMRGTVGLMGTPGTIKAGFYQRRLAADGFRCILPEEPLMTEAVTAGIKRVKAGQIEGTAALFMSAVHHLLERGASAAILGCTEISALLPGNDAEAKRVCIDPADALARACIAWALPGVRLAA